MDNEKKSINTPVHSETETKHEHHQMKHDVSAQKPTDHTAMDHSKMDHSKMDHTKMDHSNMDHTKMGHGAMDHNHSTQGGHGGHAGHHEGMIADFKRRFWVVLMLSIPIVILSSMIQMLFGYHLEFPGSKIILFVLSSIVFFYGGVPFLKGALEEIKTRKLGMMMLITLAIVTAYVYSTLTTFILVGSEFYFELSTLILIMLLGHWIEMKSQMGASKALEELVKLNAGNSPQAGRAWQYY